MFLRQKLFGRAPLSVHTMSTQMRAISQHLKAFATIDPNTMGGGSDKGYNLVGGDWVPSSQYIDLVDPLKGGTMLKIPDTQVDEIEPFVESLM